MSDVIHSKYDRMSHFPNVSTELLTPELQNLAQAIREHVGRTAETLGRNLLRARRLAKHGEWRTFLSAAGVAERTAQRLMSHVRSMDAGQREAVSLTVLLGTGVGERDDGECCDRRARIDTLERQAGDMRDELQARKMFPDAAARIAALEAELEAGRATERILCRDIAALKRRKQWALAQSKEGA